MQLTDKQFQILLELLALTAFKLGKLFILLLQFFIGCSTKLLFFCECFDFILEFGDLLLSFFKIIPQIILVGGIGDVVHQFVKVVHKAILFIMTVLTHYTSNIC